MASWKMAPALAAGNCVVLKPARLTPLSVLLLMEVIGDLLPPGVVNVVNGAGGEIGEYLATSKRIAKVAFTGSTEVGQQIMQYATQNIIPVTLELGGKSPNIFFADVMDEEDAFFDKALEGFALFAFNQGEVCTCPSPCGRTPQAVGTKSRFSARVSMSSSRSAAKTDDPNTSDDAARIANRFLRIAHFLFLLLKKRAGARLFY
jgi:hypothetical protein